MEQRLRVLSKVVARKLDWLSSQLAKQKELLSQQETLPLTMTQLEAQVATLEATYQLQGRKEKPYSRLAKARRRLATVQRKLAKVPERLQKAKRAAATHRSRLELLQAEHAELKAHLDRLRSDNENNPEVIGRLHPATISRLKPETIGRLNIQTIGRLNPDGSEGSCTACHGRHLHRDLLVLSTSCLRAAEGDADVYFLPMDATAFTQYSADGVEPLDGAVLERGDLDALLPRAAVAR